MTAESFLDTNVLVYAAIADGRDKRKRERALELIDGQRFGTSAQVLQEFYVTVVRKAAVPLKPEAAMDWVEQLVQFPCQPIDHKLVRVAIEYSKRFRTSYWDAAVIAAAEALGCRVVYSEDLNNGQTYGSVKVVNPFVE